MSRDVPYAVEVGHGSLLQYFSPGGSHGQRSRMGCSPWGRKEWGTTERLSTRAHADSLKERGKGHMVSGKQNIKAVGFP